MPGTIIGASKTKLTYIRKYMEADPTLTVQRAEDKYRQSMAARGAKGGVYKGPKGFANMNKLKHRQASAKGGSRSKRKKAADE